MFTSCRKHVGRSLILAAVFLLFSAQFTVWVPSFAATTPVDFTGFSGSGFAPSPAAGQLDSDVWRVTGLSDGDGTFGGTHTSGDFARGPSTGGKTTGGIYAFDIGSGNVILGVQPTDADFTSGDLTLRVENTTGATVTNVYISYEIWVYNDEDRANSLNLSYSTDDSSYTPVVALDFTTPELADATPAWTSTSRLTTVTGINLANGAVIYLKWTGNDVGGSGSRDEYGIDDIEVRVGGPTAVAISTFNARSEQSSLLTTVSRRPMLPLIGLSLITMTAGLTILKRRRPH